MENEFLRIIYTLLAMKNCNSKNLSYIELI